MGSVDHRHGVVFVAAGSGFSTRRLIRIKHRSRVTKLPRN